MCDNVKKNWQLSWIRPIKKKTKKAIHVKIPNSQLSFEVRWLIFVISVKLLSWVLLSYNYFGSTINSVILRSWTLISSTTWWCHNYLHYKLTHRAISIMLFFEQCFKSTLKFDENSFTKSKRNKIKLRDYLFKSSL